MVGKQKLITSGGSMRPEIRDRLTSQVEAITLLPAGDKALTAEASKLFDILTATTKDSGLPSMFRERQDKLFEDPRFLPSEPTKNANPGDTLRILTDLKKGVFIAPVDVASPKVERIDAVFDVGDNGISDKVKISVTTTRNVTDTSFLNLSDRSSCEEALSKLVKNYGLTAEGFELSLKAQKERAEVAFSDWRHSVELKIGPEKAFKILSETVDSNGPDTLGDLFDRSRTETLQQGDSPPPDTEAGEILSELREGELRISIPVGPPEEKPIQLIFKAGPTGGVDRYVTILGGHKKTELHLARPVETRRRLWCVISEEGVTSEGLKTAISTELAKANSAFTRFGGTPPGPKPQKKKEI